MLAIPDIPTAFSFLQQKDYGYKTLLTPERAASHGFQLDALQERDTQLLSLQEVILCDGAKTPKSIRGLAYHQGAPTPKAELRFSDIDKTVSGARTRGFDPCHSTD